MSDITLTFAILVVVVAMFIWNKFPAAIVAVGSALAFYFAGILDFQQTVGGFGDPTVILIASLFVISAGLEASGVGAWAGQLLIQKAGASRTRLLVYILLLCAGFSAVISVNGAVATMLPIVIVVAVRTAIAPSKLLLPIMCVGHAASLLTLLGAPLNSDGVRARWIPVRGLLEVRGSLPRVVPLSGDLLCATLLEVLMR